MVMQYKMILKFSTGWKILIREKYQLNFLCQMHARLPPIISADHLIIKGYSGADRKVKKDVYTGYQLLILQDQLIDNMHNSATSSRWIDLSAIAYFSQCTQPYSLAHPHL